MSSPAPSANIKGFKFGRNLSLLNQNGSIGFEASGQVQTDVAAALASDTAPFPQRDVELAEVKLQANTSSPIEFARGSDKISFTASGSAFAGLGVYRDGAALLKKLTENAEDFSLEALELVNSDETLLCVLRWGYTADGKASGAMALGPVGKATLSVSGGKEGLFAVIRRVPATNPARAIVQETADSWMLPRQIVSIDQIPSGTWIVAEVAGRIGIKLGTQLGYDFNWVREAKLGGLTGDIGLRLQMGINAAVGFSASGRSAVVVSRDSDAKTLRLRLFRLKTRQLDLSFDATLGVQAIDTLLPGKIDDFIAAVFDTQGQQILKDLEVLEKWTDKDTKLSELLANAGIDGAEKLIARMANITTDELQAKFNAVHDTAIKFIEKWHDLPHGVSSAVLKLVEEKVDLTDVRNVAQLLSTITKDQLRELLDEQLSRIDFFHTPVGRLLESVAENGVLSLLEKPIGEVQDIAKKIVAVLDGSALEDVLKRFQNHIETETHLDKIFKVVNDTDFAALDALLKRKLANFLGQDNIVLQDLDKVRRAVRMLLDKQQEYYEKAIEALHRKYSFALNAAYQSSTTDTALLDASFDFSHDPASVSNFFQQAVQGKLDDLLTNQPAQVTIATGKISHGIKRQTQVDVTLPYMDSSHSHLNESLASVEAVPNSGGLLFKLNSSDTVASNQRKSILSLAAGFSKSEPKAAGVRMHQDSLEMNYTLLFAKRDMEIKHVRAQVGPAVQTFFRRKIASVPEFLAFLDRHAEEILPNGPNRLGSGLISLQVSMSQTAAKNAGQAWLSLPNDPKDAIYLALSRAIQASLKANVHNSVFNSPEAYTNAIDLARTVLAYCAIVPLAPPVDSASDVPYWQFMDATERGNMLSRPQTLGVMTDLLTRAQEVLKGDSDAGFFEPDSAQKILNEVNVRDRILEGLLFAEAEVVKHAFQGGLNIAKSQSAAPSEAVKALATFGAKLTEAFNGDITTLLGPGIQALGTRVFLDASKAIDRTGGGGITETNAMLNLEFLTPASKFDAAALFSAGRVDSAQLAFADRLVELGLA